MRMLYSCVRMGRCGMNVNILALLRLLACIVLFVIGSNKFEFEFENFSIDNMLIFIPYFKRIRMSTGITQ